MAVSARFVVDATGPRGFLHRAFALPELALPDFPRTQALYTHFRGVRRLDEMFAAGSEEPPYPIDDAAVHHVSTAAGSGSALPHGSSGGRGDGGCARRTPKAERGSCRVGQTAGPDAHRPRSVRRRFSGAPIHLRTAPGVPQRTRGGKALGSAAIRRGFVDPLLSTAFHCALGVTRLSEIMEDCWPRIEWPRSSRATPR